MINIDEILVSTIMNENIVTIKELDSIDYLDTLFLEFQIGHILVVDEGDKLTGLISRRDYFAYVRYIAREATRKVKPSLHSPFFKAKELMTTNLVVLKPTDSVREAKDQFIKSKYNCLPIVENGQIFGMLTPLDLLKLL